MIISISGRIGSGKDLVGKIIQYLTALKKYPDTKLSFEEFSLLTESEIKDNTYLDSSVTDWEIKKFADKLKDIVCLLTGCTREQLEDQEFKNKELGEEWKVWYMTHYKLSNNINEGRIGKIYSSEEELLSYESSDFFKSLKLDGYQIKSRLLTPRLLLQLLGTECGRDIIHPNIWINSLMSEYRPHGYEKGNNKVLADVLEDVHFNTLNYPKWVITDCRFKNELKAIKDRGGISIRVKRPLYKYLDNTYTWEEFEKEILKDTGERIFKSYADKTHLIKPTHESETALDDAIFDYEINNDSNIESLIQKIKIILEKESIL